MKAKKKTLMYFFIIIFLFCSTASAKLTISIEDVNQSDIENTYLAKIIFENNTGILAFSILLKIEPLYDVVNVTSDHFVVAYNTKGNGGLLIMGATSLDNSQIPNLELVKILFKSRATSMNYQKLRILKALIKKIDGSLIKLNYTTSSNLTENMIMRNKDKKQISITTITEIMKNKSKQKRVMNNDKKIITLTPISSTVNYEQKRKQSNNTKNTKNVQNSISNETTDNKTQMVHEKSYRNVIVTKTNNKGDFWKIPGFSLNSLILVILCLFFVSELRKKYK